MDNEEWYYHPMVKRAVYISSGVLWLITQPYIMPIWMFFLMYFVGGMSLAYCIVMSFVIVVVAYKIWK